MRRDDDSDNDDDDDNESLLLEFAPIRHRGNIKNCNFYQQYTENLRRKKKKSPAYTRN